MKEAAHKEFTEAYKQAAIQSVLDSQYLYANRMESFHDGLETALNVIQVEIRKGQKHDTNTQSQNQKT